MTEPLLSLRNVTVRFTSVHGAVDAVRGVDLDIAPGEVFGLVGESGSGKSALSRALLGLNHPPFSGQRTEVGGSAILSGQGDVVELIGATPGQREKVRAHDIAMIFQDALSALNPVVRVGRQVAEALRAAHPAIARGEAAEKAVHLLARVGIEDAGTRAKHYPHQLSGGQRQRVMIAIAVARKPRLLIADEPTTALDVTVQARVLTLLKALQVDLGMAMLFITHDLSVIQKIADRVAVMYAGRVVETGPTAQIFERPQHPYTKGLLQSRPGYRVRGQGLIGTSPDPRDVPPGCAFAPRCPDVAEICRTLPPLRDGVRCARV